MAKARDIEIPHDVLSACVVEDADYVLYYTHDERVPAKWRGKLVTTGVRRTVKTESGKARNVIKEYEDIALCEIDGVRYRKYLGHRLRWYLRSGEQPPELIDHVDDNGLNNRPENLQDASHRSNSAKYKEAAADCTFPYVISHNRKGAWWYQAKMVVDHQTYFGTILALQGAAAREAAMLMVILKGEDELPPPYKALFGKWPLLLEKARSHKADGTLPDFVRLGTHRKRANNGDQ